ncbi:hypothetical protein EGW08_002643 [Elysia chlorotica]|uniref:AB hydrolase-1 domain-containing protein n=1 Tax=Elysia chlorotica TaxID=188477 RepID=A0A433U717_ELYCH|nr:hypothetical protein EGW08_002643 [Elysia chlorotica]
MALQRYVLGGCVLALLAIFLKYPAPRLSTRLQAWKDRGSLMSYKDRNIFYIREKGSGSDGVVVCLHGFPTSSFDWIKILPKLQQLFSHVVMLDFLGFGFSDKPQSHVYTIAEQADIVEKLLGKLGVSQAHILSHDYGDTVALELLARFNEQRLSFDMQSLVMLNGGVFPNTHHPRPLQKVLLMPVLGHVASRLFSYPLFCRGFGEIFGEQKPSKEDYDDFWAALRYNDGDKASVGVINFLRERQTFKERWVGALTQTNIKVLMVYGPADPVNPPEFATHFRATVPRQHLAVLADWVGHYPQWEDPGAVGEQLALFMEGLAAHRS